MANKRTREENILKEKERKFNNGSKKLTIFTIISLVATVVVLALFLVDWAQIYNTTIAGKEVSFTGLNCLFSALTGNFTSTEKIYGDMAIPFYYYAESNCQDLGLFTLFAGGSLVLLLACQVITLCTKKQVLNVISLVLSLMTTCALIISFVIAIQLNGSQILPIYCSGNPACSIRSYAIIPTILAFIVVLVHSFAVYKYLRLVYKYKK